MKKKQTSWKKRYKLKKRKPFFKNRFFWVLILVLIILGTVFWWIVLSPNFQVKKIEVSGNEELPEEEIQRIIDEKLARRILLFPSKSIFLVNLKRVKEGLLEHFPKIAKVELKRRFPDILSAQIEEREPVAIFYQKELPFFVDKEGVVFEGLGQLAREEISKEEGKTDLVVRLEYPPTFSLGERIIEKETLELILEINKTLEDPLGLKIDEFVVVSALQLKGKTSEGWWIYFSLEKEVDWQITELDLVLKTQIPSDKRGELEYIDLRFDKILIFPDFSKYKE